MSDPMDITTLSGTAGDAPPTKPSLRVTDATYTGFNTREEDLAHGPLLSGFGAGPGDSLVSYPNFDLVLESSDNENDLAEESVLPLFPSRLPQPGPTQDMSISAPSQSGPSFSVPESISYNTPFPWTDEFSWEDSHLCFGGQPLERLETRDGQFSRANPCSEHAFSMSQRSFPQIGESDSKGDGFQLSAIAGIGSFDNTDERWDANRFLENLEVAFTTCSVASDVSLSEIAFRGEFIDASQPTHVEIALQETVDSIVDILVDDFYRSYAPQKRTVTAKGKEVDRSSSTSTKKSRRSIAQKGRKPGPHKRQNVGGDGGSEDEESGGNREDSSSTGGSSEDTLFWACPFMKWKPSEYRVICIKKLRDIYSLKKHITEKHIINHCDKCFLTYREDYMPKHLCCLQPYRPVRIITKDMEKAIKERSDTKLTHKEQWERIFKIIFPHKPIPSSPYLDYEMTQKLCASEDRLLQPPVQQIIDQLIHEAQLESHEKRVRELISEKLLQELWDDLATDGGTTSQIASKEEEVVEHAQTLTTAETEMNDYSYSVDTMDFEYDQDETIAVQPDHLMEVENTTAPIPDVFANQSELGDHHSRGHLGAIDTYGITYTDVAGHTNFQGVESDAFLSPGGGDLPWYQGHEMYETEVNQMWGD
ncbi:hypothetical protein IL306_013977 [Fusarium sp. DS 682]|nr:hypothetical protein IL306_013977 [Fusarium sp. DS 682]